MNKLLLFFFGPLSYTRDVEYVLQKYLDLLPVEGELYFICNNFTELYSSQNQLVPWIDFLSIIEGVEAKEQSMAYILVKKKEKVVVPSMKLRSFSDYAPPIRVYDLD